MKTFAPHKSSTQKNVADKFFLPTVLFIFAAFGFQLWFHAVRTSATVDEVQHILAGHKHLQCGDFGVNPEHPPLLKLLAAAPLAGRALVEPEPTCGARTMNKLETSLAGYLFVTKNGADNIVIPARLAAASMSLLLAGLVFGAALRMFGRFEAAVALALLAFEPNIVAHGSLVTTDMAVSAGIFAAVYCFYRYRKNRSAINLLLVGLSVGLTLSVKHSGVLIVPILFLLLVADVFLFRKAAVKTDLRSQFFGQIAAFAAVCLIGFVCLWASYGFRYYALPNQRAETLMEELLPANPASNRVNPILKKTVKTVLQAFPESYVYGFADIVTTNSRPMILFGELYPTGRWFYFPIAFSIKTSVALLVLLPFGLLNFRLYRERPREMLFLTLPPLVYFAISLTSGINIGVRHLLPVYAFFAIVAAAGAGALARKYVLARAVLIALLIYHVATAVRTAPDYLAFANDFWGGTNNTHNLLADSNVDWGQNLKLVNEYLERENIGDCWFAGYGGGELARATQPCKLLFGAYAWSATENPVDQVPPVIEGTVLLSHSVFPPRGGAEYESFLNAKPVATIGGGIFVYRGRFEILLAAALSRAERSSQLLKSNRISEALADANLAVEFAPEDAHTHLALALALAADNQVDSARREFETAIRLAEPRGARFETVLTQAKNNLRQLPE